MKRKGRSLVERELKDALTRKRVLDSVLEDSIELAIRHIMECEEVTSAELARRIHVRPSQVSRDLGGGLSRATLARLAEIANALHCDLFVSLKPRKTAKKSVHVKV